MKVSGCALVFKCKTSQFLPWLNKESISVCSLASVSVVSYTTIIFYNYFEKNTRN